MKKILKKLWIRIICGKVRKEGNYFIYWGENDGESYIFKIGTLRSLIVDRLCPWGHWTKHPLVEKIKKLDLLTKTVLIKQKRKLENEINEVNNKIEQHISNGSTFKDTAEKTKTYRKFEKLKARIEKYDKKINSLTE